MADDTLTDFAEALATQLTVVGGLTGYAFWPNDFGAVVPAVAIIPKALEYSTDEGGKRLMSFALILFAARVSDSIETGTKKLFSYLDDQEAGSIKALIETDVTVGGTCDYCLLVDFADIRLDYVLTPNGPQYIGAVGSIEVVL